MSTPHETVQNDLESYWKKFMSESHQEELITNERRWALWLSMKRDALLEQGFTRSEAIGFIRSLLIKVDPVMHLNVHGVEMGYRRESE